jgi:hypothetical protein
MKRLVLFTAALYAFAVCPNFIPISGKLVRADEPKPTDVSDHWMRRVLELERQLEQKERELTACWADDTAMRAMLRKAAKACKYRLPPL